MADIIFLWGMPGSGKTTLGKKLAKHLKFDWIDTDALIAKDKGKSIQLIFESEGESAFRLYETEILNHLQAKNSLVVSCGGGFPVFNNNWKKMLSMGFCIYLEAEISLLSNRILNAKEVRPILNQPEESKIIEKLSKILNDRKHIYEQANLTIKIPVKPSEPFILQASSEFEKFKKTR